MSYDAKLRAVDLGADLAIYKSFGLLLPLPFSISCLFLLSLAWHPYRACHHWPAYARILPTWPPTTTCIPTASSAALACPPRREHMPHWPPHVLSHDTLSRVCRGRRSMAGLASWCLPLPPCLGLTTNCANVP